MPASSTVCNIGDVGVSRRRAAGWIALTIVAVLVPGPRSHP